MKATLYTDGGARGNPGPAGIGYVLKAGRTLLIEHGEYIGRATNNQAEYAALIQGLRRANKEKIVELVCYLDSELIVHQMNGQYRVRDAKLKPLFREVEELEEKFNKISFRHVPRAKNKRADALVNKALDAI